MPNPNSPGYTFERIGSAPRTSRHGDSRAQGFWDKNTKDVWVVRDGDPNPQLLGSARGKLEAYDMFGIARFMRVGDFMIGDQPHIRVVDLVTPEAQLNLFPEGYPGGPSTASRTAAGWVLDELADVFGLNTPLGNGWSVLQPNGGDPVLFREFSDYDSGKVSAPDSSGVWNWSVHARLYQVHVGSGAANTAEEAMSMVEQTYAEYKRTASRTAQTFTEWMATAYPGKELLDLTRVERSKVLNEYQNEVGDGNEVWANRRTASSLTWGHETAEQSILGEDVWFAYSGDGFNASVSEESPGSGRFTADLYTDSDLYKHLSTTEYGFESVDEAKSFVEGVFGYSRVASRTAGKCPKCDGMGRETYETDTGSLSTQTCTACGGTGQAKEANRRTAFLDTVELTEPRHRVAGWSWDNHLNGFIAAEAAREFTCACGDNVPAPGYTDCRCGKRWNAYQIRANGSQKMIAREVPVRDGVVMARRTASRRTAQDHFDEQLDDGYSGQSYHTGDSHGTGPWALDIYTPDGDYFDVVYGFDSNHCVQQANEMIAFEKSFPH